MAGKGDKLRKGFDRRKYDRGWDNIDWSKKTESSERCPQCNQQIRQVVYCSRPLCPKGELEED